MKHNLDIQIDGTHRALYHGSVDFNFASFDFETKTVCQHEYSEKNETLLIGYFIE